MRCYYCNGYLVWGGDVDISDEDETFHTETNLTCSECGGVHVIYCPKEGKNNDS